ncbi:hypothetical protein BGZ65_002058 [Modicella reniformis]|uniref:Uncharacterized protein n=1 Tax=Modicella reniformis TaxID=1440133 RepID=A0A9P6M9P4_9FUNG|nr:hypothetical protein BGZ65_002058 [Modicella reniformis]
MNTSKANESTDASNTAIANTTPKKCRTDSDKINNIMLDDFVRQHPTDPGLIQFFEWARQEHRVSVRGLERLSDLFHNFRKLTNEDNDETKATKELMAQLYDSQSSQLRDYRKRNALKHQRNDSGDAETNLSGPGTKNSSISGEHFILTGKDISNTLMTYRAKNIKKERQLREVDDLLTLNFIFTKSLLQNLFSVHLASQIFRVDVESPTAEDSAFVSDCSSLVTSNDFLEFNTSYKNELRDREGVSDICRFIIEDWTRTDKLWLTFPTTSNEATFQQDFVIPILKGAFGRIGLPDFWDTFLPVGDKREPFKPDGQWIIDDHSVVIMEAKKPGVREALTAHDERKLLSMMKLSLNEMLTANVVNPAVVGVLVQDRSMEVLIMELNYEALKLRSAP